MKEKLVAVWSAVQPLVSKALSWSPFAVGVAAGYFGKPIIKLAVDLAARLVKFILGL